MGGGLPVYILSFLCPKLLHSGFCFVKCLPYSPPEWQNYIFVTGECDNFEKCFGILGEDTMEMFLQFH